MRVMLDTNILLSAGLLDKSFPPKEKKYQESQDEYDATSSFLDE